MALTKVQDRERSAARMEEKVDACPVGSLRLDLTAALLPLWMVAGLYLDGSAHHNMPDTIDTFFTPWHAVLYSGFLASAGLVVITAWRNISNGYSWRRALPAGYALSLVGAVIFFFSGAGDFLWHEAFGFEIGLQALVSPTHLTLAVGGILIVSGPLRAALYRPLETATTGWKQLLPVILSLLGILSVLTFFTGEFSIITYPHLMVNRPAVDNTFLYDLQALASVLIPSALLMGVLLFALRQWTLPTGSLAMIIVANGLLMTWFHLKEVYQYPQVLFVFLLAGIAADALYQLLKPSVTRVRAFRLFAFSIPAILFALFFAILITTAGMWWSVHLWTGSVFLAGVVGLLLSYLVIPSAQSSLNT
jgi:hypothetical protein